MRERERLHTEMFARWINSNLNKTFNIIDRERENSEIDSVLKEDKSGEEILIQCVAYRGVGLIYSKINPTPSAFDFNIEDKQNIIFALVPTQYNKKESIIDYIKKKERSYELGLVSRLVLLVEATVPTVTPEELKSYFPEGYRTSFRGIYFVQLPVPNVNKDYKYDKEGFIYELKSCNNI